tara:strand:- start:8364 stop:8600 length:237 start_codon:yes stop_codon:yes gene_type:complete
VDFRRAGGSFGASFEVRASKRKTVSRTSDVVPITVLTSSDKDCIDALICASNRWKSPCRTKLANDRYGGALPPKCGGT